MKLTLSSACPTTGSPVMVATGDAYFEIPLLQSSAIGAGDFNFSLTFAGGAAGSGSSGITGKNFTFPQDVSLANEGGGITFQTGQHTHESFSHVGGGHYSSAQNNTSSTLRQHNSGTPSESFSITSGVGNFSTFHGLHSSIATPGRLKSLTDRYGNTQTHHWEPLGAGGPARLMHVTDSYGRKSHFHYYDSAQGHRMKQVTDFIGRQTNFQYDSDGRLVAVVGPSITRGANSNANTFPNGTAYVFQYDVHNPRSERRDDLIKVWYPNQVAPYLDATRTVDVASVYAHAKARQHFSYYNDPTDTFNYGKIQQLIESASGSGAAGSGAYSYIYVNTGLPANLIDPNDPITTRTIATDRNGNQTIYDFNSAYMLVHKQVFATRGKNSLEASSWESWTKYNSHNQPLIQVMPEGNSTVYEYEDQNNTIQINGMPYAPRIGLLKSMTRLPGNSIGLPSRPGSNGQKRLTELYFYDPLFTSQCAMVEVRGNPIDEAGKFFVPQNGGVTPTASDRSRYATITSFDYQKDTTATVQSDSTLQSQLGLTSTQIGDLIAYVDSQMNAGGTGGPLPAGFAMGLGDVNGEGTGAGTGTDARHQGCVVQVQSPTVRQLVPNTGSGDPWSWQSQTRLELYTNNARGQVTTYTNAEGNLTVYVRYPENNPDGDNDVDDPSLSNHQYGRVKETVVDADPSTVMTLVGTDGDMIAFIANTFRTNTPGVYQNLTTTHQGTTGCTSCNYDPLGNVLTTVDARGNLTNYERNELGEVYRVTMPAPYSYQVETSYDANRNVIQVDTQDMAVEYTSTDPSDPDYAKFTPTGSGTTANVPMTAGPGGAVRPGWFSNLYSYDLLDNKIEDDIDATGSTPSSLVTTYAYDFNQNLIKVTKPMHNLVEYDYDERDMRIATRVGYDPGAGEPGSVTVQAFDGNGNLMDTVGPVQRGTASQSLTVVINDAFNGTINQSYTGDWVIQNTYDGFDRLIESTDAVAGSGHNTFDPGGRTTTSRTTGTAGGPTPTDRSGSENVTLSSSNVYYDEAGRAYDRQQGVFLNTGISGVVPLHTLASGRTVTHTGGGLEVNSTINGHIGTVTLTSGHSSYVLNRTVYDRLGRTTITATDNTAQTTYTYDGADRQLTTTDPVGNVTTSTYDANSNVTGTTRTDQCTISSSIATEIFSSIMLYDVMNRLIIRADQGADGATPIWNPSSPNSALMNLTGYDSRGNRTNTIDPKQNTAIYTFDGANRQIKSQQHLRTDGEGTTAIISTVTTQQKYDGNSRLTKLTDSNGGTTTWTYDTLDRQKTMVFHDGSTRTYGYDEASDLISYTDENGSAQSSSFDPLGRKTATSITLATNVGGTTAQSFQYDGQSRQTFARDSISSTDADASFTFDSLSRVVEEVQTYDGNTRYITHEKWKSITQAELTYPNGRKVGSGYDPLYRRNSITETSGSTSITSWQFFGQRTATVALGNGMTTSYMNNAQTRSAIQYGQTTPGWGDITTDHLGYDGAGRLIGKRHFNGSAVIVGNTTAYDPSGNKLFERALHAESRSFLYDSYDSMDRLLNYQRGVLDSGGGSITTSISLPGTNQEQAYNLDALGNWSTTTITPEGGTAAMQSRTHNKLNEVTHYGVAPVSTSVLYDHGNNAAPHADRGNGNIANDGVRLYRYDAMNRLIQVNSAALPGTTWAVYTYDASGRRIRKVVTNGGLPNDSALNGITDYLYDGQQIIEDRDYSNAAIAQYIWGQYIDELIQKKLPAVSGAPVFYLLSDLLYRSVALTDSSASIVEAYDTDAYGNTICYSAAGTGSNWFGDDAVTTDNPQNTTIFTGRQYDPETQIYWYRARYFNPVLGRFIGRDPKGYIDEYNLYQYTGSAPTTRDDPLGLDWVTPAGPKGQRPVWVPIFRVPCDPNNQNTVCKCVSKNGTFMDTLPPWLANGFHHGYLWWPGPNGGKDKDGNPLTGRGCGETGSYGSNDPDPTKGGGPGPTKGKYGTEQPDHCMTVTHHDGTPLTPTEVKNMRACICGPKTNQGPWFPMHDCHTRSNNCIEDNGGVEPHGVGRMD